MLTVLTANVTAVNMKRYHHGNLRDGLLRAAAELLDAGEPLGLRAVARRAGVSQAAPYRHFADKDALLAAIVRQGMMALEAAMVEAMVPDPLERLQSMGVAYVEFAVAHPGWFRLMFGYQVSANCDTPRGGGFVELRRAVAECVETGVIQGDLESLTLMCWSLVHGLSHLMLDGQGKAAGIDVDQAGAVAARVIGAAVGRLA